jgi:hypothetical protein
MTTTISRPYDNHRDAEQAASRLENAGVPHSDISIVANNSDDWYSNKGKVDRDRDGTDDRAEGAGPGAGIGAGLGGAAGLLAGLGLLAIPGLGPVVAAGWLVATARGGRSGCWRNYRSLTQARVPEEDAHRYAEGIRRGGTLVSARVAAVSENSTAQELASDRMVAEESVAACSATATDPLSTRRAETTTSATAAETGQPVRTRRNGDAFYRKSLLRFGTARLTRMSRLPNT